MRAAWVVVLVVMALSGCAVEEGTASAGPGANGERQDDAASALGDEDAGSGAEGDFDGLVSTPPTDCGALCGHVAACDMLDDGTEEECVSFCEENPAYFPPRTGACAEAHLADGQCDEPAFEECAKGPVLQFFELAAASVCGRLTTCCPENPPLGGTDECAGLVVAIAGGFINATELMGYLTFDEAVAETCAVDVEQHLAATECASLPSDLGPFLGELVACEGLLTPHQAEGDPCGIEADGTYTALPDGCMDGLVCQPHGDAMPTCEPGLAPGADCSEEGAECRPDDACVDGACWVPVALGETCTQGGQCHSGTCEEGVCVAPPPLDCSAEG